MYVILIQKLQTKSETETAYLALQVFNILVCDPKRDQMESEHGGAKSV